MPKSWRDLARPIIAEALRENEGKDESEIKKALKEAYPFGQRAYHPYKIWLDEIKVQRKLGRKVSKPDENQKELFYRLATKENQKNV
jgi:hypothetical protein